MASKLRLTMIYEGEFRGLGLDGQELPRCGPLSISLLVPERMIHGPFRDLKVWFCNQHSKRYHHKGSNNERRRRRKSDGDDVVGGRSSKSEKVAKGPPKFSGQNCRFVKKDGSGVYDVDTISRSLKDNMTIWLVEGGERDAGKEDEYKASPLVGAASESLYAVRRQRAQDKANQMDKLYAAHAQMIAEQEDIEGIILKRAAVALAHKAYSPLLTELTTLGLIGEVKAYLRDEACDAKKAVSEARNPEGDTPLALACMFGHRDVVLELLKHGADPDQPSSGDDWTPMVHASRCCHHEIVQDLLDAGANRSRLNASSSVWSGDHVLQHSYRGIGGPFGRTTEDREKTTQLIQTYDMASSWIEVIDDHWESVRKERLARGESDDPSLGFKKLAAVESYKNTKGRPPKYLPYVEATELVQASTINHDQLDRLQQIWKLIATARAEDDTPDDGVVEGESDPVMSKTRLLAALVDRRRNAKIRRLLMGDEGGGGGKREDDLDSTSGALPSLMVLLKPNLWKEAFLEMDSRLGAGRIAFDEFVAFVLVSDSPSGVGRATLRQMFDTLDPNLTGFIRRKDLLKALSGVSMPSQHAATQNNDWAVKMIRKIPSLRPLLKPSSWTILFPPRVVKTREQRAKEREEKYANVSLRDEALEKVKSEFQGLDDGVGEDHDVVEEWGSETIPTKTERSDKLNFSDFFDRAHKCCSEIGKFLPYKDESMLREERISVPGDDVFAKWKGSREYYPSTIIFANPPYYSVSYESGEYDPKVKSSSIIYPEDYAKVRATKSMEEM